MRSLLAHELKRTGGWLLAAGLLGWALGHPWLALCLVLAALLLQHLWSLSRFMRWLASPEEEPPEANGLWGQVLDRLYHQQRLQQAQQQELRELLDRIQDSGQALRDGVVMLDKAGDLEWWNQAAEQLLGLRQPSDLGQPITHLVREPRFIDYFEQQHYQEPLVIRSPLADDRTLEFHITLFGANERLLLVRDFTRMQRLERMRQDFIANVSHELRTPLTVLSGYLETFSDHLHDLAPKWQRGLKLMGQQAKRMENLVEDLLMLSRLETTEVEYEQEPLQLRPLLESIRTDALALSEQQHSIQLHLLSDCPLYGSEKELRSAFSNLVFNAVKYTPPGTSIEIYWEDDEQGGGQLIVQDHGPGIEARHLARLTERFYRVDPGRSTSTGGTGLGLAIVKHVLLRHGAQLTIQSRPGEGSRFCCHFPAQRIAGLAD